MCDPEGRAVRAECRADPTGASGRQIVVRLDEALPIAKEGRGTGDTCIVAPGRLVERNVLSRDYEVTDTSTSVGDRSLVANRNSIASATCSSVM